MQKVLTFGLALLTTATLAACDENPIGDDAGTMSMLLTDAPGDLSRAIVTIERIELMHAGEEDEEGGDRVVLRDVPWTGDLLALSNDVVELVDAETVPGGAYHQLRFVISGGCIELEGEGGTEVWASTDYTECGAATGDLHMPSYSASGLKVNLPSGFEVSGDDRIVLVDFDVAESFGQEAGGSGRWVMRPVVRATEIIMSGSLDVTVTVADTVDLPGELSADSFFVRLDQEPEVAVTDGVASFAFLVPGTYTIDLVTPEGVEVATDPELPLQVQVGSSQDAVREITITGVL